MTGPAPTNRLADALDALVAAGEGAGLDAPSARAEGLALSAAVLETGGPSGAPAGWAAAVGRTVGEFFENAPRGRRYAAGATPLLAGLAGQAGQAAAKAYASALAEVAVAACTVDGAPVTAVGKATVSGQAQLAAAGVAAGPVNLPREGAPPVTPPMAPPGDGSGVAAGGVGGSGGTPGAAGSARFPGRDPFDLSDLPNAGAIPGLDKAQLDARSVLGQLSALQEATRDVLRRGFPNPFGAGTADEPLTTNPSGAMAPNAQVTNGQPVDGPPVNSQPADGVPAPAQPADGTAPATPAEPPEPEKSLDELMAELDELIGLAAVKKEIHRQVALLKIEAKREKAGLKSAALTRHLVFVGNPGTGKTTVARLVGGIYRALGLLAKGQLVEVDRSELVAGYLGQTAQKTIEVTKSALGGVLFIDEAYTLKGDQYAQEAVDTIVKEMEDHRDDLVVIVAGYPEPMAEFIEQNPGLASRFRTTITFEDYTDDEITDILKSLAAKNDYDLAPEAVTRFREILAATPRGDGFGNGRFARNTLEEAIGRHAWRLRDEEDPSLEQLRTIERIDLEDRPDGELPPIAPLPSEDDAAAPAGAESPAEVPDAGELPDESEPPDSAAMPDPAATSDPAEPTTPTDDGGRP
ncbi:MAG: AAA family ATPase [Austwickia sp.]|nr:MAG: AAA family ATPase [Austwickia sp.]